MGTKISCNKFSLDVAGLKAGLKPYFVAAMEEAKDKLIEIMRQEVYKSHDGKHIWRDEIADSLDKVEEHITDSLIEYYVGARSMFRGNDYSFIRGMIVTHGHNDQQVAGPAGRSVYNEELTGKQSSNAQSENGYVIFGGNIQTGYDWISNAEQRMVPIFNDILEQVSNLIPSNFIAQYVNVSAG